MALIADSGGVYSLYDRGDAHHDRARRAARRHAGAIIVPMAVLAEIGYLLARFLGARAELGFLEDMIEGVYLLEPVAASDLPRCRQLLRQYADLKLGITDTCVIACAERLSVYDILTVDERHFRAVRTADGRRFRLLPADLL